MHAINFHMKRCHLSAVAEGRRIFRGTKPPQAPDFEGVPAMTPARFDILYLVFGKGPARSDTPGSIEMTTLRELLGLAAATVSQAVDRLVELGLVTKEVASWNGRKKVVRLTAEGTLRIKKALHLVFNGRALRKHYDHYVDPPRLAKKSKRPWRIIEMLTEIRDGLQSLASHLFDTSTPVYEMNGRPDDDH